jgi:hypothetical protein
MHQDKTIKSEVIIQINSISLSNWWNMLYFNYNYDFKFFNDSSVFIEFILAGHICIFFGATNLAIFCRQVVKSDNEGKQGNSTFQLLYITINRLRRNPQKTVTNFLMKSHNILLKQLRAELQSYYHRKLASCEPKVNKEFFWKVFENFTPIG